MKTSIFYQHKFGRRFPVPLIAFEMYAAESSGVTTDSELYDVLVRVLAAGCRVTDPDKDDIEYLISRLTELSKEMDAGEKIPPKLKKSFGTSYMEYLYGLSIDSTVLRMVNYEISAATALYCEFDRDDTIKLVKEYLTGKIEENVVKMEASMYGNGGKYKSDNGSGEGRKHDLNTPEGLAKLKSLGF